MTTEVDAKPDSVLDQTNRRLAMNQRTITWDDYWVRFVDVANRVVSFGHVLTESELRDLVHWRHHEGLIGMHGDGYVLSQTFSIERPEGEYTSPHRSSLWPIGKHLFEDAQASGWVLDDLSQSGKYALVDAYQAISQHNGRLARLR